MIDDALWACLGVSRDLPDSASTHVLLDLRDDFILEPQKVLKDSALNHNPSLVVVVFPRGTAPGRFRFRMA